jgi:hypothetical protein
MGSLSRLRMVMMVTQRSFAELAEGLTEILQDTNISIISDFGGKTPRVNALRFHIYCICGTVPRSKDAGHGLWSSVPWHG